MILSEILAVCKKCRFIGLVENTTEQKICTFTDNQVLWLNIYIYIYFEKTPFGVCICVKVTTVYTVYYKINIFSKVNS